MSANRLKFSLMKWVECLVRCNKFLLMPMVVLLYLYSCSHHLEQQIIMENNFLMVRNSVAYLGYNENESVSYQINVSISNDTIFFSKTKKEYSSGHFYGNLVNATGQAMTGDSLLLLDTNNYWFIPFAEETAFAVSGGEWEFKCGCGGYLQPAKGCEIKKTFDSSGITFCNKPPDVECETVCIGWQIHRPGGGGNVVYPYGGVIVKGDILIEL